ncbi:DUF5658 family protein [Robertmurraya korlensis]|uniref:DUF5658 family protein n=1 Tax=Robertmurraya korlensis TaxID=519977 RepID=UPI0020412872|nr:DUF5658 family protein [Robertmurraya korlensis]MCM3599889.1 DUF5658 family protein [Robertmurraya korlensis]
MDQKLLGFLFIYLALLNIFDAIATAYGLSLHTIREMNPFMNGIYHIHPLLFLSVKISLSVLLISMGVIWESLIRKKRIISFLIILSSIIYTPVCFTHIYWMTQYYLS